MHRAIVILLVFSRFASGQTLIYQQDDPAVVVPGVTQTLLVQVLTSGSPTRVTFESVLQANVESDMRDDGTGEDRVAGDSVYTISLQVAPYLARLQTDDVFRLFIGYIRPYQGTSFSGRYNIFIDVFGPQVPSFPVIRDAPDVQHTDYLVNIRMPAAFPSASSPSALPDQRPITNRFYSLFPDDIDVLNLVYFPSFFQNRTHYIVRNSVRGIGAGLIDNGRQYGSAATLKGISTFPLTGYYDGAGVGFQHEFTHQWVNYLNVSPLASGIPHWPYSTMASGLMGFSIPPTGEGGSFPCLIVPEGNGIRLGFNPEQPVHTDMDLYLMGLLPAEQVSEQIVLNTGAYQGCGGTLPPSSFTRLRVQDLISNPAIGLRDPDSAAAQKVFRTATVLVTRDDLLSPEAMALYSLFAQRAELTAPVAIHEGFLKATAQPFALSTRGLGKMVSRLSSHPFNLTDSGGVSLSSDGSGTLTAGYARIRASSGSTTPSGLAIFGYRQSGILVSEAGVPDSPLISSGRIYAEVSSNGVVNTGLAIANPNPSTVTIAFTIRDTSGNTIKTDTMTIGPNEQMARFLDQAPYLSGTGIQGTFSFTATLPVSVVALRGLNNERSPSEFLMTTLPVVDLSAPTVSGTQVIPHFAAGDGWTTQILLVNPTSTAQTGMIQFLDPGTRATQGAPKIVRIDGALTSSTSYTVAANSSRKFVITAATEELASGSVQVIPMGEGSVPTPLEIFSYNPQGITVSEASVPVTMGTTFRMFAQLSQSPQIFTGVAIANPNPANGSVALIVTGLDGRLLGTRAGLTVPASGQIVGFLDQLIPSLAGQDIQGVLQIATSLPRISVVGLRARYNERQPVADFLITTTPPILENSIPGTADRFFPHLANGDGYSTQFILFSGTSGQASSGSLQLFSQSGGTLDLTLR